MITGKLRTSPAIKARARAPRYGTLNPTVITADRQPPRCVQRHGPASIKHWLFQAKHGNEIPAALLKNTKRPTEHEPTVSPGSVNWGHKNIRPQHDSVTKLSEHDESDPTANQHYATIVVALRVQHLIKSSFASHQDRVAAIAKVDELFTISANPLLPPMLIFAAVEAALSSKPCFAAIDNLAMCLKTLSRWSTKQEAILNVVYDFGDDEQNQDLNWSAVMSVLRHYDPDAFALARDGLLKDITSQSSEASEAALRTFHHLIEYSLGIVCVDGIKPLDAILLAPEAVAATLTVFEQLANGPHATSLKHLHWIGFIIGLTQDFREHIKNHPGSSRSLIKALAEALMSVQRHEEHIEIAVGLAAIATDIEVSDRAIQALELVLQDERMSTFARVHVAIGLQKISARRAGKLNTFIARHLIEMMSKNREDSIVALECEEILVEMGYSAPTKKDLRDKTLDELLKPLGIRASSGSLATGWKSNRFDDEPN